MWVRALYGVLALLILTGLALTQFELPSREDPLPTSYVQHFDDSQTVAAVNEIEQLTTGLSRKIWQKLVVLNAGS